ncbi:MAG: delta-60 repeat domain-containing protein [Cellvibrionales bacterium]|nr:delta-60 repeat domain-containing protein [Cellvibrionales bacterium]
MEVSALLTTQEITTQLDSILMVVSPTILILAVARAETRLKRWHYRPMAKILLGGAFNRYNGMLSNRIARLLPNGSIDATFNIGIGADNSIGRLAVQSDGKIIIGGGFTSYHGTAINRIARLNTDGSLDSTFQCGFRHWRCL